MKFEQQVILSHHTNRLRAASAALVACNTSLQEPEQVFQYANQLFTGPDAVTIKQALITGLSHIANEAQGALINGGITFDVVPEGKI